MSIETLLLLIFVIVLPLIEMFWTALQKRQQKKRRPQEQPDPVPRPSPVRKQAKIPPQRTRLPDVAPERPARPDVPVLATQDPRAEAARETISDKIAAGRRSTKRRTVTDALLDEAVRTNARTIPTVIGGLKSPGGMHRAMVVMAILGPCRAVDSYTSHQS